MSEHPKYDIPANRINLIRSDFTDPHLSRVGMRWSADERATLCEELKGGITDISELARIHGRTERAIRKYIEKLISKMIEVDALDDDAIKTYNFNPITVASIRMRIRPRKITRSMETAS